MNMRVHAPGRDNLVLARNDIRTAPHNHALRNTLHDIRIPRLANSHNDPLLHSNISLVDTGIIDNKRVRNNEVQTVSISTPAHLPHALPQRLAAPKLTLVPVRRKVALDLHPKLRRAQAHAIPRRRPKHGAVRRAIHRERRQLPPFP